MTTKHKLYIIHNSPWRERFELLVWPVNRLGLHRSVIYFYCKWTHIVIIFKSYV